MLALRLPVKRIVAASTCSAAALLAAFTLIACSADKMATGPGAAGRSVCFSLTTQAAVTTGPSSLAALTSPLRSAAELITAVGPDTLVITRAQVVLSRLELASSVGTDCEDEGDHFGHDCEEIRRSFVLLDLPTDTTVHTLFDAVIPPGTYSSLEAKIRVPRSDSDSAATSFLTAHPEFAGANVRVEGTFRGVPFVYTGAVNSKLELDFSPPIVVDSTGLNVTMNVDLASWFLDGTGALIDPTTADSGGANAALVADNIRRSFHAFRDDHRDGHDDGLEGDEGHSGGSGEGNGGDGDGGHEGH